ncbi:MAG: hypothetical protein A3F68_12745 [Acidobacteria bacterium RIFCSPLOWO2_12_FULL_54_10]|nr:MAG: hypothetical protein A3F68_12745 [Acidobacteria bacterium RIFCSPLOWO2_12_FULL_54_10]
MLTRLLLIAGLLFPASIVISQAQQGAGGMKVRHIHIRVSDVEKTKLFYRDKMGMKLTEERPGQVVEFEGGALWFGKWQGQGPVPVTPAIVIGIEPPSVQALYDKLKAAGVAIANPPKEQSYGWSFMVKDPDGYMIEVEGPQ